MKFMEIKKEDIEPSGWNPRTEYDKEAFDTLKKSIESMGIVEPVIVRPSKKKGKYSIIAGEGRWKGSKKGDKIPCIIRDDSELDAKIISLVENYVRTKVSDVDHEKFIAGIYAQGLKEKPKKWNSYVEMYEKTGIPQAIISRSCKAYDVRQELNLDSGLTEKITTKDISETAVLEEKPKLRKKLLETRAEGRDEKMHDKGITGGHDKLRDMARTLSKVPEPVAEAVLNEKIEYADVKTRVDMLGGQEIPKEVAEDLVDKLADEKPKMTQCGGPNKDKVEDALELAKRLTKKKLEK